MSTVRLTRLGEVVVDGALDRRVVGTIVLAGAVLGLASNALHPVFAADVTPEEFLRGAVSTRSWLGVHLALAVAVVVATLGLVLVSRLLAGTPGRTWAEVTAVLAVVTGTIFTAQLAGIDGVVMAALATELAEGGGEAVLGAATAWVAFDVALLSFSVAGFLGATQIALGWTLLKAEAFSPWLRWALVVVGVFGLVIGVLMYFDVAVVVVFYAFRVVGLATTVVGLAMGLQLHRSAPVVATTSTAGAR